MEHLVLGVIGSMLIGYNLRSEPASLFAGLIGIVLLSLGT